MGSAYFVGNFQFDYHGILYNYVGPEIVDNMAFMRFSMSMRREWCVKNFVKKLKTYVTYVP